MKLCRVRSFYPTSIVNFLPGLSGNNIVVNMLYKYQMSGQQCKIFVKLMAPFLPGQCPHLWQGLLCGGSNESVWLANARTTTNGTSAPPILTLLRPTKKSKKYSSMIQILAHQAPTSHHPHTY